MDQKGDPGISAPKVLEHDTSDVLQYHLENIFYTPKILSLK